MNHKLLCLTLLFFPTNLLLAQDANELFQSGNRITFLGGTSVERMQSFNYLESLITSTYPNRNLHFRNLGWSGDDVFGTARAVFGKQADGFKRLEKDLLLTDPDVIMVCYGANESYSGESGLAGFLDGLSKLLDTLEKTEAKILLISPSRLENLGKPLPDPSDQNLRLAMYIKAMKEFAQKRKVDFVDFFEPLGDQAVSKSMTPAIRDQLTDNGLHLSPYGHWRVAPLLARKLGVSRAPWNVNFDIEKKLVDNTGVIVSGTDFNSVSFKGIDKCLPYCAPPETSPRGAKMVAPHDRLQVKGLAKGTWGMQIDGNPSVVASAAEWGEGVYINRGLYLDQSQKLRKAINEKNELFFHRHRPQNETYLFLFRKHEQGNNAVEIPKFDKLIADKEAEIAKMKLPASHQYKLVLLENSK